MKKTFFLLLLLVFCVINTQAQVSKSNIGFQTHQLTDLEGSLEVKVLNAIEKNTFQDCGQLWNTTHEYCAITIRLNASQARSFAENGFEGFIAQDKASSGVGFREAQVLWDVQYYETETNVKSTGFKVITNETGSFNITEYEETQTLILKTRREYVKVFSPGQISLDKYKPITLRFIFTRPIFARYNVDIAFKVLGVSFGEYAWWNTTGWQNKALVTVNYTGLSQIGAALFINVTNSSGTATDFADIRFINVNETQIIPATRIYSVNGSYALFALEYPDNFINASGKHLYIYKSNSTPVADIYGGSNNASAVFKEFFWNFSTQSMSSSNFRNGAAGAICYLWTGAGENNGTLTTGLGTATCSNTYNITKNVSVYTWTNITYQEGNGFGITEDGTVIGSGDAELNIYNTTPINTTFRSNSAIKKQVTLLPVNGIYHLYGFSMSNSSAHLGSTNMIVNTSVDLNVTLNYTENTTSTSNWNDPIYWQVRSDNINTTFTRWIGIVNSTSATPTYTIGAFATNADTNAPNVSVVNAPSENVNSTSQSITFNVTASDDVALANVSIYLNATGTWLRNATNSTPQNGTPNIVTINNLPENNRTVWVAEACDTQGNCAFYNANRTFIVDLTAPLVTLNSPADGLNSSSLSSPSSVLNLTARISDGANPYLANISLFTNATGVWARNLTVTNAQLPLANNSVFTHSGTTLAFPEATIITWNYEGCDWAGRCAQASANRSFVADATPPYILAYNTADNLNISTQTFTFNNTLADNYYLFNATVRLNGVDNTTNSSVSKAYNNTPILISVADLVEGTAIVWRLKIGDGAGNVYNNIADGRTLVVDLTAPNVTTVNSPANNLNVTSQSITFNVTVKDNVYLRNASIFHNATGVWHRNATNSTLSNDYNNTPILVSVSNLPASNTTSWIMEACDSVGRCGFYNANQTLIVDLTAPNVTQRNNANGFSSNGGTIVFNVTATDNVFLANASVFFDLGGTWQRQGLNSTLSAIYNNSPIVVSVSNVPNGNYLWNMEVCDAAGFCSSYNANSTFTVTTSGGSGGGGGGGFQSYSYGNGQIVQNVDFGQIIYSPQTFTINAPFGQRVTQVFTVDNRQTRNITLLFTPVVFNSGVSLTVPKKINVPAQSKLDINFLYIMPYKADTFQGTILVQTDSGNERRLGWVANVRPFNLDDLQHWEFWDSILQSDILVLPLALVLAILLGLVAVVAMENKVLWGAVISGSVAAIIFLLYLPLIVQFGLSLIKF